MKKNKFNVGDMVRSIGDADKQGGVITEIGTQVIGMGNQRRERVVYRLGNLTHPIGHYGCSLFTEDHLELVSKKYNVFLSEEYNLPRGKPKVSVSADHDVHLTDIWRDKFINATEKALITLSRDLTYSNRDEVKRIIQQLHDDVVDYNA